MNKKIYLVTGVAGFIGSKIAEHFIKNNIIVVGLDNLSTGYKKNIPEKVIFFQMDCASKSVRKIFKKYKIDAVIHFAGQSSGEISFENPLMDISSNLISTINLIQLSILYKCNKFMYASSMSVYGQNTKKVNENSNIDPISFYAIGKSASEKYLNLFKNKSLKISALRLFNVYGPGQDLKNLRQGMISIYISQLLFKNKIIVKGSKNRYRDFVYIDDVVKICSLILKLNKNSFEIFNVCTGKKTTVSSLISKLIRISKSNKKIVYNQSTPGDQYGIYGNNNKLIKLIKNFQFTDIDNGLKKTFTWANGRKN